MAKNLYYGGPILTMKAENDYVESLVEEGGKIIYTGSLEGARKLCGDGAEKTDLQGKTLMPSFIDPHGHISMVAQFTSLADLSECTDFDGIVETLKAYQAEKQIGPDGIIMGFGYDHNFLKEQRHPDKSVLDRVSDEIPIYVLHTSSHMGAGNSAMLKLAGISSSTPDPEGARFGRVAGTMEPDGYAEEMGAIGQMLMAAAPRLKMDVDAQIVSAQETYLKNGITTCQDGAAGAGDIKNFARAASQGNLVIDVVSYPVMDDNTGDLLKEYADYDKTYRNHFKIGGLKIVLDGSPQGKTAWLSSPYEGEKDYRGYPAKTDEEVFKYAKEAIATERCAMTIAELGFRGEIEADYPDFKATEKLGAFVMPWDDNKAVGVNPASNAYFINKDSKYVEEAKQFFEFLAKPENLQKRLDGQPELSALCWPEIKSKYSDEDQKFLDSLTKANVVQTSVNYIDSQWMDVGKDLEAMYTGAMTPQDVLDTIMRRRTEQAELQKDPGWVK